MRNGLNILLSLFITGLTFSQVSPTSGKNYVHKVVYKKGYQQTAIGDAKTHEKVETVNYLDGLGRPVQSVAVRAGGANEDIITFIEYDMYGRQIKDYLPYAALTTGGTFRTDAYSTTNSFYTAKYGGAVNNPYSEKHLEASPLNRMTEQAAPGTTWALNRTNDLDKTIKFGYESNASSEVKKYTVSLSFASNIYTPTLQGGSSYYGANELYKTITKDENWKASNGNNRTTQEFKNKRGQVILKRTYNAGLAHDTYYVYDDYGNLSYVLPPKAEPQTAKPDATELLELCYQYKYDDRNRLVEKKIPGKGWESIVYNLLDQPVLTQDANQREKSPDEWLFTKYDAFGRITYTGRKAINLTRANYQVNYANNPNGTYEMFENRQSNNLSLGGTSIYYTNDAIPTGVDEIYTVNYYDSYIDLPSGLSTTVATSYGITSSTSVKGLATVSKVKVLDTSDWITTVTYYDDKSRPIYVYSKNDYLNTTDIIESKLDDFSGRVLETKTTHKKTGKADIVTIDRFEYDHQGRVLAQTQYINGSEGELIARNHYDELGQLEQKDVGGKATNTSNTTISTDVIDLVGVSVSGNIITKTSTSTSWNAGLATNSNFANDGYVEYEIPQANKYVMVGLSDANINASYTTIDYAMYNVGDGRLYVYESGSSKGQVGTYQTGDIFRVERIGSTVYYKQNGQIVYTSSVASTGDLLGDVSIYQNQGKIKDLTIVGYNDVFTDLVGVSVSGNIITKTSASTSWNAGLATNRDFSGDGYVEYEIPQANKYVMVGLSDANINASYTTIDYAMYNVGDGRLYVYESGSSKGQVGTYQTGDIFRVERIGSTVYYKQNGQIVYTSSIASTGTLLGDISIYQNQGKIKDLKIIGNVKGLQTIDYKYNVRGWLTDINDINNLGDDLFTFNIRYDNPTSGTALYNGNISQVQWKTKNSDQNLKFYRFYYDALNRMIDAQDNMSSKYRTWAITYDKNGNLTRLYRKGHTNVAATSFGDMDKLFYTYQGKSNKLRKVLDNGNDNYGFKDGVNQTTEYTYDANGNMKTDANKGITNINYNQLNLPTQVTINGQNISYVYDAGGAKLRKTVSGTTTDYAGNHVYENGNLQFFNTAEGYVTPSQSSFKYIYQYKDHLGNVRLSYNDANGDGTIATSEIIEENNYYPFGLKHKGYNVGGATSNGNNVAQRYKFGGKELQDEIVSGGSLEWYDITARNYDPALGRWMNLDPLAEQMRRHSPYNYAFDNPVFFTDPDGMAPMSPNWKKKGNTYIAERGDSAYSLYQQYGKKDGFTASQADAAVQKNRPNYTRESDGMLMSNVEVGDKVSLATTVTEKDGGDTITSGETTRSSSVANESEYTPGDGSLLKIWGGGSGNGIKGNGQTGSGKSVDMSSGSSGRLKFIDPLIQFFFGNSKKNNNKPKQNMITIGIVKENSVIDIDTLDNGNIIYSSVEQDTTVNIKDINAVHKLSAKRNDRKMDSIIKQIK